MDEIMNETAGMNDVTIDDEQISSYDDEGSMAGAAAAVGVGILMGIVIDRFVAPAVGKALDSARKGLVKMLTNGDENKSYTEVDSEDSKVVEIKDSAKK